MDQDEKEANVHLNMVGRALMQLQRQPEGDSAQPDTANQRGVV